MTALTKACAFVVVKVSLPLKQFFVCFKTLTTADLVILFPVAIIVGDLQSTCRFLHKRIYVSATCISNGSTLTLE